MIWHRSNSLGTLTLGGVAASVVACLWLRSWAKVAPSPALQPPTLLQQLSNETQQLYTQSRRSMVRVQLPTPQWLEQYNARQNLINKWGPQLDPMVREKFIEDQERALKDLRHPASTHPATSSATQALTQFPEAGASQAGASQAGATQPGTTQPGATQPGSLRIQVTDAQRPAESPLALFAIGLLVDQEGHAVFPVYVDKKSLGDSSWPAVTGEGEITTAKFVGSDLKTNLTVLQLEKHSGVPASLGHRRPEDGVLTLSIASDGSAKLVVWNNQRPEPGFAILTDGAMAGFGFKDTFLGASQAKPVVDQLIATGEVHRALLGVLTQEVGKNDPLRRQRQALGTKPAIRILKVADSSAASRGGILPDDLILKIGDDVVGDAPTFAAVVASRSGETVLLVLRGDKLIDLTVNLQAK